MCLSVCPSLLGGSGDDTATGITVDSVGSAYVGGYTNSTNFLAGQAAPGDTSSIGVFVVKLRDTDPPTAPTNLRVVTKTTTTVNLAWDAATDNVGVTTYTVFNGATVVGTTSGTTYTVTGLTPNTSYTFTVKAQDPAGNISPASNAVIVTTNQVLGTPYDETYTYDQIGNLTTKAGVAYSYKTDGSTRPHAVSKVGTQVYTYDANGNLLTGGGRTIPGMARTNSPVSSA